MTASGTRIAPAPSRMRRFARYPIDLRLQVRGLRNGSFFTCWGRSTEIGQDGIGATLTGDLQVGQSVSLELPLPLTHCPVTIRAAIRYRQGQRYGFEFFLIDPEQREAVLRVCNMLAGQ